MLLLYTTDITTEISVKLFSESLAYFTNYTTAPCMKMMTARLSVHPSVVYHQQQTVEQLPLTLILLTWRIW